MRPEGRIRLIISSALSTGASYARRRGWVDGLDCLVVYSTESLQMTCWDDWQYDFCEADPLGITTEFRQEIMRYRLALQQDNSKGFGDRHLTSETN